MRNTSAPRAEATTIAAMVPLDKRDDKPELGISLVGTVRIPRNERVRDCTYKCVDAVVTLIEPTAKRLLSSLVIVSVCRLLLSPVRKKSVVATSTEDAPFRMTLALSSFTENLREVLSRNPKTVTAVPSGAMNGQGE
jgi:hypothetical protein